MPLNKFPPSRDPYDSNEYLLLRAGSAESADAKATNLLAWINRGLAKSQKIATKGAPKERLPRKIYIEPNQQGLPTAESAQRVISLIDAFVHAGVTLRECLERSPERYFYDDPPRELLDAYRAVNKILHAYRGEYGVDTHPHLRQPALDKFWKNVPKAVVKAEIRKSRTLDPDVTSGLLLGFVFTGKFTKYEQQAVADLLKLVQDQRFHLLRKCKAKRKADGKMVPCERWFLAARIDQQSCTTKCGRWVSQNTPEYKAYRKIENAKHYATTKKEDKKYKDLVGFAAPKPSRRISKKQSAHRKLV
jgi:hypothetical protein